MEVQDIVAWSPDRLLSWSDFKAESNPAAHADSHSHIRYHCTWTVSSEEVESNIMFRIENIKLHVHFHPRLSWVRPHYTTDAILLHEQGHFDLAEQLRLERTPHIQKNFAEKRYHTRGQNEEQQRQLAREDSTKVIYGEIERLTELLLGRRNKYDEATDFGHDPNKQSEFSQKFGMLH